MADIMQVSSMMNGVLMHADASENLLYLTELIVNNNAHAILIREGGLPVGIVTTRDIVRSLIHGSGDPREIRARDVMTKPLVTIDHSDDVTRARELMVQHNLRKLPVRKDFDVIGLFVQDDLIRDISWSVSLLA